METIQVSQYEESNTSRGARVLLEIVKEKPAGMSLFEISKAVNDRNIHLHLGAGHSLLTFMDFLESLGDVYKDTSGNEEIYTITELGFYELESLKSIFN